MGQALAVVLLLVIGAAIYNKFMNKNAPRPRKKAGDVIDISEAWISMDNLPYRTKDTVVSNEENDCYQKISQLLAPDYCLLPRVRLADFLTLPGGIANRQAYQARINDRAVDFLICTTNDMHPQVVVIIENDTDARKKQIRDGFVRAAVEAAGITTIAIKIAPLPEDEFIIRQLRKAGINI